MNKESRSMTCLTVKVMRMRIMSNKQSNWRCLDIPLNLIYLFLFQTIWSFLDKIINRKLRDSSLFMGGPGEVKNDRTVKKFRPEKIGYDFFSAKITGFWIKKNAAVRKDVCRANMVHYKTMHWTQDVLIVSESGFNIYTWSQAVLFDVELSSTSKVTSFQSMLKYQNFISEVSFISFSGFWKIQNKSRWALKIMVWFWNRL